MRTFKIAMLALGIALLLPTGALRAQPIAECGVLVAGLNGCVFFEPYNVPTSYIVFDTQGFAVGDEVFADGEIYGCFSICLAGNGCLDPLVLSTCGPSTVPFEGCGTLIAGTGGCTLFESGGNTYLLDNQAGFSVGDEVYVTGDLDAGCASICAPSGGCIGNTALSLCPSADNVRGDCNADGSSNIADAVYFLGSLFPGMGTPNVLECEDACDSNDDGALNIADAVTLLSSLFGSPPVPLPDPTVCGPDLTVDVLACSTFAACP